jgi:hypothetical protein
MLHPKFVPLLLTGTRDEQIFMALIARWISNGYLASLPTVNIYSHVAATRAQPAIGHLESACYFTLKSNGPLSLGACPNTPTSISLISIHFLTLDSGVYHFGHRSESPYATLMSVRI